MTGPLLVCKGLAKKFKLKTSGVRNWLGQIMGMRNEEWVNGCMPGLCVAFAGSNSDVKLNDRLPIIEETHEGCCGRKRSCFVKKHAFRKATRVTQRTQQLTNGYFGGYVGKRQPAGSLETKKCVDKLFTLRAKIRPRGFSGQVRATSARMVSDLEMASTYRGAVEVFNLCRNLHPHDVLFAECIRTFKAHAVYGKPWLERLETSQNAPTLKQKSADTYVPPTRKPNVRTDRARANEFDIYGYRPLKYPWKLLSAYEFLRQWRAEPLLIPTYYSNRGQEPRTRWTQEGNQLIRSKEYRAGKVAAEPRVHYVAVESELEPPEYVLFQEELGAFRHSWALVRKRRNDVVIIEGCQLPSARRSSTYNSKYCSIFFRPWTLLEGDAVVPHLSLLGVGFPTLELVYGESPSRPSKVLRRKQPKAPVESVADQVHWGNAWSEYVRGNVVSESAEILIRRFLLNTIASTGKETERDDIELDESEDDVEFPRLTLPSRKSGRKEPDAHPPSEEPSSPRLGAMRNI